MKAILLGLAISSIAFAAWAQGSHYVEGYVRSNGTYVAPHYQTNPNDTVNDNWSTRPNVNPYTGQPGTRAPDYGYHPAPTYRTYEAPRGQSSYGDQRPSADPNSSYGGPAQPQPGAYGW